MALTRAHRLSLRFHRERLTQTGKTAYGKFFTAVSASTPVDSKDISPRFAILLSKKTASLAVERNKIKRISSGLIESLFPLIPQKDYLVIPKKQVLTEKNETLKEDLKNLFQK